MQGAVPPLCLQHSCSLLISLLSGDAVIIWGWASTMDNYPEKKKKISNCVENTAFSEGGPECTKNIGLLLVTAIMSVCLSLSKCP